MLFISCQIKNKLILQNRDDEKIILNSKLVKKEQVFIIKGSGVEIEKFYPSKFHKMFQLFCCHVDSFGTKE